MAQKNINHFRNKTSTNFNYLNLFKTAENRNYKRDFNPTRLTKNIKELVLSNRNYISYFKKYNDLTTEFSFKNPKNEDYPIRKNEEYLKIGETTSASSSSFYITSTSFQKNRRKSFIKNLKNLPEIKTEMNSHSNEKFKSNINLIKFEPIYSMIKKGKKNMEIMDNFDGILKTEEKNEMINFLYNYCMELPNIKNQTYKFEKESIIKVLNNEKKIFNTKLICESMSLKFRNVNLNNEQIIYLPFSFLPLYYMLSFDKFKLFLSNIIKFNLETEEFVIFKPEIQNIIYCFFKHIKQFIKNEEYKTNISFNINENTYNLKYDWILYQEEYSKSIYEFEIILPNIKFIVNDFNTQFIKKIPKILMIHLIKNSFQNWEKFTTDELNINISFRKILNEITNKKSKNHMNKIYNLSEHSLHSNKNECTFFFTDEINMTYYEIISFYSVLILSGNNYEIYKKFKLNLEETKNLLKMNKIWTLMEIIHKCLFINKINGNIILKLDLLKDIDVNYFEKVKEMRLTPKPEDKNLIKYKSKNLKIEIVKPYFSNYTIDNYGSISKSNYCFPLGLLKNLLINKKRDFPKIYFKEKKGFNYVKSFKFNDIEKEFLNEEKRNDFFKINPSEEKIILQKRFSKQPSSTKTRIGIKPFHRSITGKVGITQFYNSHRSSVIQKSKFN